MATILVVDDLTANRDLLVTLLQYRNHRVLQAKDGSEALAVARAEHPDLVVTDVLMPVMDGYELVRQLRLDPQLRAISVIFCTAHYAEREARALALECGVSYVLTKPVEPETVLEVVARLLAGESGDAIRPDVSRLTPAFDREHLRLVTDKLSEKAEDLSAANARLKALINIGLELASERDADRLLQDVAVASQELFGATYVTLGILDRVSHRLQRIVGCGASTDWIAPGDAVPAFFEEVVASRRTRRGDNSGGAPENLRLPAWHPGIQAFLVAPVASPAHVYGWICLAANEGRPFTADDEQLLVALAGQVGRIYENGYFYQIAQRRAEELEREVLERKQTEETLRVSEARLNEAQRNALIGSWRYLPDGTLTWSDQMYELFKLPRDVQPTYERVLTVIHPEDHDGQFTRAFGSALASGATEFRGEFRVVWPDGQIRYLFSIGQIHRAADRRVIDAVGTVQDITERKQAEEEVRRGAQLSALGAAIGLALIEADSLAHASQRCAEAIVVHLDAALVRIWTLNDRDHTPELQASAGPSSPVAAPESSGPVELFEVGRVVRDRKPYLTNSAIGDPEVRDQDWMQRERIQAFAGHPLIVEGRLIGVMALFSRHTLSDAMTSALASVADHVALGIERHRSAEALRTSEERVRFALQSADVGIWDMDVRTGVLRWSDIAEGHYGVPRGAFRGTFEAFIERVHPDDRESVIQTVGKTMKTGGDFTVANRSIWPDGTVRWLNGSGRVVLGEDGAPVRAVGISLDVTERRNLELQYQQAQKMEAVGRLAGGVAHDFNNLLTAILGYCELLLVDLGPHDPRHADVEEIQRAGLSAAGLTRQLLAFSRKQIIEPTLLDLNVVLTEMHAMLGRLIGEDVKVVLALRPHLARVKADRGQVEQIVLNLAVNARDAMPGGGSLTIETSNIELDEHYASTHFSVAPGFYVALTVTDTGTGMPPEVLARLFEPFFTTKEVGKGTGLGLATVHGVVARTGGSVNVYSEVGRGTSFKVYFPRADSAELVAETHPALRPPSGTETVLVAEDAEGLRELTRKLLQRQGYLVLLAANADEAIRLFDTHPDIDILLTDVVMPGASGPDLTKRLIERRPGLKVIYMSGYTEDAIVQHGVLNPGIAFLHKPFTSDALGRKIREVLDRRAEM